MNFSVDRWPRAWTKNRRSMIHPFNRYVAGLPAGLLAKSLQIGGGSFTLDAACASSLYAFKLACDELLSGRADAMLAGGVSRPDSLYTQMGFSQLRALSPRGRCSPFDQRADGLVVGEGGAIFILKRLSDALEAGDTIHAIIHVRSACRTDMHGNLLAPAQEGQLRAMQSAYMQAQWPPGAVDMIECHATGTPVGDGVEFRSLRQLWETEEWDAGPMRDRLGQINRRAPAHRSRGRGDDENTPCDTSSNIASTSELSTSRSQNSTTRTAPSASWNRRNLGNDNAPSCRVGPHFQASDSVASTRICYWKSMLTKLRYADAHAQPITAAGQGLKKKPLPSSAWRATSGRGRDCNNSKNAFSAVRLRLNRGVKPSAGNMHARACAARLHHRHA